jgi:hypothetical protein
MKKTLKNQPRFTDLSSGSEAMDAMAILVEQTIGESSSQLRMSDFGCWTEKPVAPSEVQIPERSS